MKRPNYLWLDHNGTALKTETIPSSNLVEQLRKKFSSFFVLYFRNVYWILIRGKLTAMMKHWARDQKYEVLVMRRSVECYQGGEGRWWRAERRNTTDESTELVTPLAWLQRGSVPPSLAGKLLNIHDESLTVSQCHLIALSFSLPL